MDEPVQPEVQQEDSEDQQKSGNVRVAVRVRPFSQREIDEKCRCIIEMQGKQTIIIDPTYFEQDIKQPEAWQRKFDFDHSFWSFDKRYPPPRCIYLLHVPANPLSRPHH
jgi:hypothetical protein